MKNVINYLLIFTLIFTSCNNEDDNSSESDPEVNNEVPELEITATESCLYSDITIEANSTVKINCLLDLKGQNITIPEGVTFEFDGGDVFNGTLNFASAGKIDGQLLNSELTVEGNVTLTSEEFQFYPYRWGIIEGTVDDQIATSNRDILESLFLEVKELAVTHFKIGKLNAYFKIDGQLIDGVPSIHAINIPSNFNLIMSDETHIRMQAHGHFRAALLAIYDEKNITISGGNLYGDREEHNYNSGYIDSDDATGPTHEWVDVMRIRGGQNITIDGVSFIDPAGDGIQIAGIYHYFDERHIKSTNISIKNCVFLRARRTNIVITSGEQIFIEQNEIIDGGINLTNSSGIAPSSNLNIEADRGRDNDGNLIEYQHVSDIYIKNNKQIVNDKEAHPSAGSFQISHGNGPIIIEDNEMINTGVSFFTTDGVIIRNNTIAQGSITAGNAENFDRVDFVFGNIVSGNTVITNSTAMNVAGNGSTITDNHLEGNIGVSFGPGTTDSSLGVSNTIFKNNTVIGNSRGISTMNTMKNVTIEENSVYMTSGAVFAVALVNEWDDTLNDANFIFKNNTVTGGEEGTERGAAPTFVGGNSIIVEDNVMGEIQFGTGSNIDVLNNNIEAEIGHDGILFKSDISNVSFDSNTITIYPSQTPLQVECIQIPDNINLTSVTFDNQVCIEK